MDATRSQCPLLVVAAVQTPPDNLSDQPMMVSASVQP